MTRDDAHNSVRDILDAIHRGGDRILGGDLLYIASCRWRTLAPQAHKALWAMDRSIFNRNWKKDLTRICETAAAEISEGGSIADYGF